MSSKTVLIVDDEPVLRTIVSRTLDPLVVDTIAL